MADAEELLEIVDENNVVIGTSLRSTVHAEGLLHRAAYCFVFDTDGKLLLQKRHPKKKIGGGLWDLSVAEHVQPGESCHDAAARGLVEELGIAGYPLVGPLAKPYRRSLKVETPAGQVQDEEFVESFVVTGFNGQIKRDPAEVAEVMFKPFSEVLAEVHQGHQSYTPWLQEQIQVIGKAGTGIVVSEAQHQ